MPRAAAGAVSGQKPEPTLRPRAEGRKKKSGPAGCQDYDAVGKKNCLVSSGAGTNTIITPVCPSEPLCASIADGAESLPLPADTGRIWAAVPGHFGTEVSPSRPLFGGRKEKQDKGRGRRWRLRPVTTARSAGSYGEFPVYQKWGQNPACDISSAVTIPKHLLPQQKNRGHTSLLRYERLLFQTGRPTSKITPHETKIEALRGAGKCDA